MSKARDIASAAPAPSTVSATELGYVDGVTSAIQTQIDSKIGSASAINPTIVDAKGDIIAATAADTVARLAVGANGTVLTAASGQATGLQWATPSSGAMVLINRSAFSAVSTLTVDDIFSDTYENYVMSLSFSGSNGGEGVYMRGVYSGTVYSAGNYDSAFSGVDTGGTAVSLTSGATNEFRIGTIEQTTDVPSINNFNFFRSSGSKKLVFSGTLFNYRQSRGYGGGGAIKNAQTWTGLKFFLGGGNFTGTFTIYGLVKA